MRRLLSLVALAVVVLWPGRGEARPSAERLAQLRAAIAQVLEREQVPGVGLALVDRDGIIWTGGVGVAELDARRPVTSRTLFRVASITKSFVALGVAKLHEAGQLDLEQPVAPLLPDVELPNDWAEEAPVTLAHLLEHTAGFDDMHLNEYWGEGAERMPLTDVLARNPRSRASRWRPGSRFSYANPGYTVAAAAIERATGRRYQDFLQAEVFSPLGIDDAHLAREPEVVDRLADGHVAPGRAVAFRGIYHHPAGALLTSPTELAKLVFHWLVRSHAVVGPAMLDRIERTATLPYPATDVDYGLGNYGDVLHGVPCRGHDGGLPGFVSTYRYCPDAGVGYVMLLNATHSFRAYVQIRMLLFQALTEGEALPPPPRVDPPADELRRYTGFYNHAAPRNELFGFLERTLGGVEVVHKEGRLWLRPAGGGAIPLVATGHGGFRFAREGGTSIRFSSNADGREIVLIHGGYFERGSAFVARARVKLLGGAFKVMQASVVVFALWLMLWLATPVIGRAVRPAEVALLAPPALATVALIAGILVVQGTDIDTLMTRNPVTVTVCALTIAFAMLSGVGVATSLAALARDRLGPGSARSLVRLFAVIASATCFAMTMWLLIHRIIGLRTWDY